MSRVGKLPVPIAAGVDVSLTKDAITVKGKLGELKAPLTKDVVVKVENGAVHISPADDGKRARTMWGTMRSNISNMVRGVTEGFETRLEINGVGYKAAVKGNYVVLSLGYSHDLIYVLPAGVTVKAEKPTLLVISGYNKQKVGQVAAEIMKLRPFEPYKGKGVFKEGKPGRRKEGKKK